MISFKDLSQYDLRLLQMKINDILCEFDAFCKRNNLTYFLTNGSCLGAVRHKGFIPWDEDLDVALPREDYEKLTALWNQQHADGRYVLCRPNENTLTGVHITQIRDASTTCVYSYAEKYDICHGIKIDVEPYDGAPDSRIMRTMQSFFANIYGLFAAQRVPNRDQPTWKKYVAKLFLPLFKHKLLCYKVFRYAEKQVKKYSLDSKTKVKANFGPVFDKGMFLPVAYLEFEGELRPVPRQYSEYLTLRYGDYMKLPSEDKRFPVTSVLYYDLTKPYTYYM